MNYVDRLLNQVTMYRLLLYYLCALVLVSMGMGAVGLLAYPPQMILLSVLITVGFCYGVNYGFARIYEVPTNTESALITGLILALLITPIASPKDALFLLAASGLAMASKYLLAIRRKHIFNPAAIAIVLTALGPQESATWWVGSIVMLPFVIAGGFLLARKIRRIETIGLYIVAALLSVIVSSVVGHHGLEQAVRASLFHSSLFFLGFVMLTEPWTSPTTRIHRYIYAVLVGVLTSPFITVMGLAMTPELALIVGNIYAFIVTPLVKTKVRVAAHYKYGITTEDVALVPEHGFTYRPGQYIEMTLPHKEPDERGVRRYFTLASSPTEDVLHVGVRYAKQGSSFKKSLRHADSHTLMSIGQLGGDFTLPHSSTAKLVFIAGGVGITPFRSMAKYMTDTHDNRSVVLLYGERSMSEIMYADIFEAAHRNGAMTVRYVLSSPKSTSHDNILLGRIDRALIEHEIPDYYERVFYLSGPQSMVVSVKHELEVMGVPPWNIKTDYFFGYV